jgi:hypothetical protein
VADPPAVGALVPGRLDDVTAPWLSAALATRFGGTEVRSLEHGEVVHGSLTKVALRAEFGANPHHVPEALYLKAAMENHGFPVSCRPEALFYAVARPVVDVEAPACWYAGDDGTDGVIVLEDLTARGCRMADPTVPMTVDAALDAMGQLAHLHARWWGDGGVPGIPALEGANALGAVLMREGYFEQCLDGPTGAGVPAPFRDRERVAGWVGELWALDREHPRCFSHGDAHLGNTYVDESGTPGFLDWGGVKAAHWAREICYFLVGALGIDDRRAHEEALLGEYLDRLAGAGADPVPTWDDAWLDYRRHVVHGLLWFLCPTAMQPLAVIVANVERFAAAARDHGVDALL